MDIIEVLPPKNRCYQVTVCPSLLVDAPATLVIPDRPAWLD